MSKAPEFETELIESVCARIHERLADGQADDCEAFVRQYYHWVPPEDLLGRSSIDLYGAAIAQWNLARVRGVGTASVRVYNPDSARDGWRSTHTVVEIISDDMPFLVDSIGMELARQGYGIHLLIHPVIRVRRGGAGRLRQILAPGDGFGRRRRDAIPESFMHVEFDRETDAGRLATLSEAMERVLREVRAAVEDWHAMRARAQAIADELAQSPPPLDAAEVEEARAFLAWIEAHHFTFLGYREYVLESESESGQDGLRAIPGTGLGVLRATDRPPNFRLLPPKARQLARMPQLLVLTKANSRSTVHRPAYLDYIGIKTFGPDGEVVGERRFLGLYTTVAYSANPRAIPIIRQKVERVLSRAAFPPGGHDAKALVQIMEVYPRDSLFQITSDQLFEAAMGILGLGERQRLKLLIRRDTYDRFLSCLVFNSSRSLQHREPGAHRNDPRRGFWRQSARLEPVHLRVGARPRPLRALVRR